MTRGKSIEGITSKEFDGITLPTLRYWLKWWSKDGRKASDAENGPKDRDVTRHVRMISVEIGRRAQAATKA